MDCANFSGSGASAAMASQPFSHRPQSIFAGGVVVVAVAADLESRSSASLPAAAAAVSGKAVPRWRRPK